MIKYDANRFAPGEKIVIDHKVSCFHGKEGVVVRPADSKGKKFYVRFKDSAQLWALPGRSIKIPGEKNGMSRIA